MKNGSNKGGGGVIILTEKCVKLEKVIKSEDKSEILQIARLPDGGTRHPAPASQVFPCDDSGGPELPHGAGCLQ